MPMSKWYLKGLTLVLGLICFFLYTNCSTSSSTSSVPAKTPNVQDPPPPPENPVEPPVSTALKCFEELGTNSEWSNETEIPIIGFTGNANEPQISADGVVLLFNNKTDNDDEMDVHYAVKQPDGSYVYGGVLGGASINGVMDGVPATDASNNFYFMSIRNYGTGSPARYRTLFGSKFSLGAGGALSVVNIAPADSSFPNGTAPTPTAIPLDMDIGVSWDGTKAIVARTTFIPGKKFPDVSQLEIFNVNPLTRQLFVDATSNTTLQNVNLEGCFLYAPTMSIDKLELYYTVTEFDKNNDPVFKLVVAKRANVAEAFGKGSIISAVTGEFFEGPSISNHDGGKTLYYHKLDAASGKFKIFKVTRTLN